MIDIFMKTLNLKIHEAQVFHDLILYEVVDESHFVYASIYNAPLIARALLVYYKVKSWLSL